MTPGRASFPLSILGALVFFIALWLLDFPKPMVDDLFYCGAGLNLAQGGELSNPLLARQEFPGNLFLVYPPLHSHAIAAWMKCFGVNAASLTGFQALMYFVAAAATILVLRRYDAPPLLEWLVPLGVATAFLPVGLRPEPFSVALIMSGFAVIELGKRWIPAILTGYFLMFMGGSAAPRMTPFAAALVLFATCQACRERIGKGCRAWVPFVLGTMALAGAVAVLLIQIQFHVREFLEAIHLHSTPLRTGKLQYVVAYLGGNDLLGKTPLLVLFVLATFAYFAWQQPKGDSVRAAIFVACAAPIALVMGVIGFGTIWFPILMIFLLAAPVLNETIGPTSSYLRVLLVTLFLAANAGHFIEAYGIVLGRIVRDPGENAQAARALRSTAEHPLLVDPATARYTFDYRMPQGSLDLTFAAHFPEAYIQTVAPRDGDVLVVGPETVRFLKRYVILNQPVPQWLPWGIKDAAFDAFPRHAYILSAEDCKVRWAE